MKRAFIFGDLIKHWIDRGDDYTPIWIKFPYGSAFRAHCGPTYNVLCCGINYPYILKNFIPKRLRQLDSVNITSMECSADFIVCACSDGKLLNIPLRDIDNFTVESTIVDYMNDLFVTHISMSKEDAFLLVNIDSIESKEKYNLLPEHVPFYQPLNIVLAHVENIPIHSTPHFLLTDQTIDSLNL